MNGDTDAPLFTAETVRHIIAAAKPKGLRDVSDTEMAEFADRLNEAASTYVAEAHMQNGPSPSERREMFASVEKAANRLLRQFGVRSAMDVADGKSLSARTPRGLLEGGLAAHATVERGSGFSAIATILHDVTRLRAWAKMAQQRIEPEIGQGPQHSADAALDNILLVVTSVWMDIVHGYPTISKSSGTAGGPFIEFSHAVFSRVPGVKAKSTSSTAIARRFERLMAAPVITKSAAKNL